MLDIVVNGDAIRTSAKTLKELIDDLHTDGTRVATALNGTFVTTDLRGTTKLNSGDAIEILTARQGG